MFEGNPFPGLRPFEFDENYLFFGREEQVAQLLQRLGNTRFLAVVGASGAIAGVIAAYWVLFPFVRLRLVILAIPIYLSIGTFTAAWLAINLWMSTMHAGQTQTAWFCHLGGFAAGLIIAWPNRTKPYAKLLSEKLKNL